MAAEMWSARDASDGQGRAPYGALLMAWQATVPRPAENQMWRTLHPAGHFSGVEQCSTSPCTRLPYSGSVESGQHELGALVDTDAACAQSAHANSHDL